VVHRDLQLEALKPTHTRYCCFSIDHRILTGKPAVTHNVHLAQSVQLIGMHRISINLLWLK